MNIIRSALLYLNLRCWTLKCSLSARMCKDQGMRLTCACYWWLVIHTLDAVLFVCLKLTASLVRLVEHEEMIISKFVRPKKLLKTCSPILALNRDATALTSICLTLAPNVSLPLQPLGYSCPDQPLLVFCYMNSA